MRSSMLTKSTALLAAIACMLLSATVGADATATNSAAATTLTPASRAALRMRMLSHVQVPQAPNTPLLKFVPSPPGACHNNFGPLVISLGATAGTAFGVHLTNIGTKLDHNHQATMYRDAVPPSGSILPLTSGSLTLFPKSGDQINSGDTTAVHAQVVVAGMDLYNTPFNQLPTFVAYLSGVANEGKVSVFRPSYAIHVNAPNVPASSAPLLRFQGSPPVTAYGNDLRACYAVFNKGGSQSGSAKIRVVLKGLQANAMAVLQTIDTTLAPIAPGSGTSVCVALPSPKPSEFSWMTITPHQSAAGRYQYEAIIIGPNDGSTATMKAFEYVNTVESL